MSERRPKTQKLPVVRERSGWKFWLKRVVFVGLLLGTLGALAGLTVFLIYASDPDMPRIDRIGEYHPKVVTKIMSSDGELIGEIFEERRTVVPREKIPKVMIDAIVDAEDAQFYEHEGLSYWGMLRALLHNLKPGAHVQGASTLTQQLVRNLILKTSARTVKRKVQELVLARRLEDKLSKDEILYLYLNQIEFPYQRFGIEEASRFYFGKSVSEVNAGEAALLASLPKGPTEIDPWKHAERAKDRQKYVLSQMVRYKHLTAEEAEKHARAPIALVRTPAPALGIAPEFVDEVKKVLSERLGPKRLATAGLTVVTTCDSRIQKLAREALEKQLQTLDERQGYRKPLAHLQGKHLESHLKKLEKEFPAAPPMGRVVEGVVSGRPKFPADALEIDLGAKKGVLILPAVADRYNPKALPVDQRFKPGDVLRVRVIDHQPFDGWAEKKVPVLALELGPQAALTVIDPATREVKAIVGGYGFRPGAFDRAIAAKRQPGSAFKPFLFATAFSTEKWTPASVLIDGPQVYAQEGMAAWKPQNAEKEAYLGPIRLRVALAKSKNTVASQLVDVPRGGVDPAAVVRLAQAAGIESTLEANPSLALGTSVVSPMELTNAYATFAAGGKRMTPQLIKRVGNDVEPEAAKAAIDAMTPELAYLTTSVMVSVIEEGTAISAKGKLKRPAAGKTGTTNGEKDAWFVGFTPDLVTGVWVGFDDMRALGRGEQGARAALPIWIDVMAGALKSSAPRPFAQPAGVEIKKIDPASGLLAHPGQVNALDEVFMVGTAPTQLAPAQGEANPDTYMMDQAQ
jgi:penicillin-binding protein 1A